MAEIMQRMLNLESGKRTPVKLDAPTWQAVDWLAGQVGQSWKTWCADVAGKSSDGENMTAAIREAAMAGLLDASVFAGRDEQLAAMEAHPIMENSGILDDDGLADILKNARVAGHSDFGGFSVLFGLDEHYQDCIWIKNGLRDGLHFAFVVPLDAKATK